MRNWIFVAVTLWLTPVIAVGMTGLGLAHVVAIVMGFVLAAAIGRWASGPLAATLSPEATGVDLAKRILELLEADPQASLHNIVLEAFRYDAKKLM